MVMALGYDSYESVMVITLVYMVVTLVYGCYTCIHDSYESDKKSFLYTCIMSPLLFVAWCSAVNVLYMLQLTCVGV